MSAETEPRAEGQPRGENRSTAALLTDLVNQVSELFRKEIQLFRAEVGEKTDQAFAALGSIATGLVLVVAAVNALVAAAIAGLVALGLHWGWSALIVGIVVALIGYGMVNGGRKRLKASSLAPQRTARSLQQDATVVKDRVK